MAEQGSCLRGGRRVLLRGKCWGLAEKAGHWCTRRERAAKKTSSLCWWRRLRLPKPVESPGWLGFAVHRPSEQTAGNWLRGGRDAERLERREALPQRVERSRAQREARVRPVLTGRLRNARAEMELDGGRRLAILGRRRVQVVRRVPEGAVDDYGYRQRESGCIGGMDTDGK
jgi:hypothetical protein